MTEREDPRVTGAYVRHCPGDDHDVVLVGSVHDHPASTYRVLTVVEDRNPDILALELPPLAVPLFEQYAEDERTPPAVGGEMSAGIQAAATDRVVGIDGPTLEFFARVAKSLSRDRVSLGTVRSVTRSLASVTRHAVVCRLAAFYAAWLSVRTEVDDPVPHDCDWTDDPHQQAEDERTQVRRARSIASAFETPTGVRCRREARDAHMVDRLESLRGQGEVVAVVGIDHLDAVAEGLTASSRQD